MAAERSDDSAQAIARLDANYRSTPSVLGAIETVFAANPLPFVDATIDFHPLSAASPARDGDLGIAGHASPGMTLHWLPALPHDPGASSRSAAARGIRTKDQEFALMREAAVQTIANLLANGRLRAVGGERALRPADIAVLTDTNDQAAAMQRALVRIGIAAATASGASVFAGETAEDLHVLLASLTEPAETGRFRAALATRLLGWRADRIAALDDDAIRSEDMLARFAAAADLWRARGPLPALLPFIADAAPRWLAETAGARRLTDALHLLELLQAESAARTGLAEQLTWFAQQCARATNDDARQLRLESDTGTVQIVTIHKSKGLEYPVVVLPFAAWRSERAVRGLVRDDFVDALGRPARAWRCKGILEPMDADAIDAQVEREAQAEAQRKLYVAMTRARHALHVVWSRNDAVETTALHWLLHAGEKTGRKSDTLDHAGMRSRIERLAAASGGGIVVEAYDPEAMLRYAAASSAIETPVVPPARVATRRFSTDLRLHSFSSLHARGGSDGDALRGADDEAVALPEEELDAISLGGTAFGNAVHAVLETVDGREWRSLMPAEHDSPPEGVLVIENVSLADRKLIRRALLRNGLKSGEVEINQVARLVRRALNAMLPGDVRLWALPQTQQVREMAFHFRLRPTRIDAVHALLQAHGYPRARRPTQATLDGLMQGYIDLVYRDAAGRHYVLDYKTNRLPAYDPESLRRAIRAQDYDLQYLIYLVALRRWLKLRRGACYDDNKDIGGAVYLFLRGVGVHARGEIDAEVPRSGVHIDRVSPSLLSALDDLFDGSAPGNASGGAG